MEEGIQAEVGAEEPGGLLSMESHRVGHDLRDLAPVNNSRGKLSSILHTR